MLDEALKLFAILALIVVNGVFVAAEFALFGARRTQIEQLAEEGSRSARAVERVLANPNLFISACQVGITVSSLTLGWLTEPAIAHLIEPPLNDLLGSNSSVGAHVVATVIALLLVTTLHIVLASQVPKMVAIQRSEKVILTVAPAVHAISWPIRPYVAFLYWLTDQVLDLLKLSRQDEHTLVYTEDELKMLVTASRNEGYLDASEQEMIERVFGFAEVETDEVMVPRTEMLALPVTATLDEIAELVAASGHTRFPVYGDDLDDLTGVFHTRDLFTQQVRGNRETFNLRRHVRPAVFVSVRTPLDELLATMKARRQHIALVVDEYGGTAGLVSLSDVLERLVGDVRDQFEPGEIDAEDLGNGVTRVSGLLSIGEVNERFGTHIEDEYYNSLGGFVFGQLGRKPEVGDEVRANGHRFRVAALDGLRIDRIEIVSAGNDFAEREEPAESFSV
ncbi:MAG: hemolysin family protein [Thermomicrobiales bacterium]